VSAPYADPRKVNVVTEEGVVVTESDWIAAQSRARRLGWVLTHGGLVVGIGLCLLAVLVGDAVEPAGARWLVTAGLMYLLLLPFAVGSLLTARKQQDNTDRLVGRLTQQLTQAVDVAEQQAGDRDDQAHRQEFETRLANALDMAEGEPEVIEVIERSFSTILPQSPVELLLADNSHAHLLRMASASPTGLSPGCGVDSPDHCPAARRAQIQRFADSDDLDACPKLRGRIDGAISSVCVPVAIMGRTVGVIHSTAEPHAKLTDDKVQDLGTLAKLAGARIGLLRVMAETQLQAATDSLTGLLNRRSFEQQVTKSRRDTPLLSLALADLDHFKALNDTYGHETGDRALRLFAQVLTGSVRVQDVVGRHGGEEFVVALVGCHADAARHILDSLRVRLDAAITVAGLPQFTVSFGVVEATDHEALPALINRADVALFQAKRDGRDRVVIQDSLGGTVLARTERAGPPGPDRAPPVRDDDMTRPGLHTAPGVAGSDRPKTAEKSPE
jgi:diguanylate cyclase (GGDEF)-like protein